MVFKYEFERVRILRLSTTELRVQEIAHLSDPASHNVQVWQVTLRSSVMGFLLRAIQYTPPLPFTFYLF